MTSDAVSTDSAADANPDAEAAAEQAQVSEKRRRRWGCLLYAGLAVLIPVLVLFGVYLWFHIADRKLAEEALARARAAGDPLTTEEMQALFFPPSPTIDEATGHWERALILGDEAQRKVVTEKVPYVGAYGVEPELDENGFYAESTLALVDEFFEGSGEKAILAAHDARRAGAVARFVSDVPHERPVIDGGESTRFLRSDVWYLLALDMERAAARGDLERATENVLSMVAVGEAFADDPTAYGMDMHVALFGMSCYQARRLIERVDLSDDQLRRIDAAFAKPDFRRGLVRILQADQWRIVQGYETDEPTENADLRIARNLPLRGADEAMTIDWYQTLLDAAKADLLAARQAKLELKARIDEFPERSTYDRFRYAIALQQAYEVDRYVNCATDAAAEQAVLRTGIACERYRLANGSWPTSLEALVPEYLSEVPVDVYGGEPLQFEVKGERLAIHSLGHLEGWNSGRELDESTMAFVVEKPSKP